MKPLTWIEMHSSLYQARGNGHRFLIRHHGARWTAFIDDQFQSDQHTLEDAQHWLEVARAGATLEL